jgi:ferritin
MKNTIRRFKVFEAVEDDSRLSKSLTDTLNKQIKNELMSSQKYRAMSCWLDDKGWIGGSKYYFKSAQEELSHMDKVYQYLFDRNATAKVPNADEVKHDFKSIREVLELSLKHEMEITKNWEAISELSKKEGDNTSYEFAQGFLKEQIEEEEKFRNLLFKLDLNMPDWKTDELFEDLLK